MLSLQLINIVQGRGSWGLIKLKFVINVSSASADDTLCDYQGMQEIDTQSCFRPFRVDGFVSMSEDSVAVPVSTLRDTAASRSVTLKDSVPF